MELRHQKLIIRPFRQTDQAAVEAMFRGFVLEFAPSDQRAAFESYIETALADDLRRIPSFFANSEGVGFWIAESEGSPVGMAGLEVRGDEGEIRRMCVIPEKRRLGIARLLMAEGETAAMRLGLRSLVLSTSDLQKAAMALYERHGFQRTRIEEANFQSGRTVGGGIVRHFFQKSLVSSGIATRASSSRSGNVSSSS